MNLFLNLDTIICLGDSTNIEEDILLNNNILFWIEHQNFSNIWIIANDERIGNQINEEIFDAKIEYVTKILNIRTKNKVSWRYCPYKQKDIILIDSILKEKRLRREDCVFLGSSDEQKCDANGYHIKFINENFV